MHRLPLRAIVAICFLIGLSLACGETTTDSPPAPSGAPTSDAGKPISPVAAGGTEATPPKSTATPKPTATATSDPCMSSDEITPDMKGDIVCTRGVIAKFTQSRQVGTRYAFSDTPNTFFLFSNFWEITNSETGKTVGVGTCVEVTGEVEIQGGVPFTISTT
jgi:hypothetical protein